MMKRETVLQHSSELNALTTLPFLRTRGRGTLRLGGVMANLPEREMWERELNRNYYACGCDTGAKGLLIGLGVGLIVAAVSLRAMGAWQIAGVVLGAAIAGAILGKIAGLLRAQGRLNRVVREIEAAARPREPQALDPITCG